MFELVAPYQPAGDQPQAIAKLTEGLLAGAKHQVLLGVTGSGKTFTVANVIRNVNRPTLVISHNKTLAAQLYAEFKGFFPNNAVEYFVSYFDYYQPEAYIPRTDTFIEKDSSINDEIERLRLSTMSSLFARRDVIVVASVSCIYGIGSKEDYEAMVIPIRAGLEMGRDHFLHRLVDLQYTRNDIEFTRGQFRVRGDTVELCPAGREDALRVEFFGDQIERITRFEPLTGHKLESLEAVTIYPGKQFVTPAAKLRPAVLAIREELGERIAWFEKHGKLLEAQRIKMRTEYDLEMMEEMGFCSGIENYSRHIAGRPPGSRPCTLFDFFPKDYLLVIDESHATVPQIGGMYEGDRSRKTVLVEYGFRLPSALDNRPLSFEEFQGLQNQVIYASATPGARELEWARQSGGGRCLGAGQRPTGVAELVVRPTGLVDPKITLKPLTGQIDDLINECRQRAEAKERVLVTTLTKRTAEELTDYLREIGINVQYLHSEIGAIERVEILRSLRKGEFDVLVGHQPAARGARPAGGVAGGHPGRRQGRVPAQRDEPDPDGGPRGAALARRGDSLRRHQDAEHPEVPGGLGLPAEEATGLQRGAPHHAAQRDPRRRGEPLVSPGNRRAGAFLPGRNGGGYRHQRDHQGAGRRDARGGEQPGVREGGAAARPDSRAEARHRWQPNRRSRPRRARRGR